MIPAAAVMDTVAGLNVTTISMDAVPDRQVGAPARIRNGGPARRGDIAAGSLVVKGWLWRARKDERSALVSS
jgi:hypothetical protein